MEGRVCTDGHVGATEVIVNGAHHANNVEMGGVLGISRCDLTWADVRMTTLSARINLKVRLYVQCSSSEAQFLPFV